MVHTKIARRDRDGAIVARLQEIEMSYITGDINSSKKQLVNLIHDKIAQRDEAYFESYVFLDQCYRAGLQPAAIRELAAAQWAYDSPVDPGWGFWG
jgi:hypothetical protein